MFVLTENGIPTRKAHSAGDAWSGDAVPGHPTTSAGMCVFDDGRTLEVREYGLGLDVWRVTHAHDTFTSYFYGSARELRREYGFFDQADRLNWDGSWEVVYD